MQTFRAAVPRNDDTMIALSIIAGSCGATEEMMTTWRGNNQERERVYDDIN